MMDDPRTDFKLTKVCPDVGERWKAARKAIWEKVGRQIRVTDGMRSFAEQWAIFGKGRLKEKDGTWLICDKKLVVTHAMPGQSFHQFGLAIDSCFMGDDPYLAKLHRPETDMLWNLYGEAVKAQGMMWGGDWKQPKTDRPHCEIDYGLSIHTIQMVYEDHGLKAVWEKCKNTLLCGGEMV